jgi:hypothetical protein
MLLNVVMTGWQYMMPVYLQHKLYWVMWNLQCIEVLQEVAQMNHYG